MRKKTLRIVILVPILIGVIYIGIKVFNGIRSVTQSFQNNLPITFSMLSEDSMIINKNFIKRLKVVQVFNSKLRRPVSRLLLDDKYPLFIYKLDSTGLLSLNKSLAVEYSGTDRTTGVTYTVLDDKLFYRFQFTSEKLSDYSAIFFTIKASNVQQTVKTDSMVGFSGLCKNMSIRNQKGAAIDFFLEGKSRLGRTVPVPLEILFYKRNKDSFLLLLTANDWESPAPVGILQTMLAP